MERIWGEEEFMEREEEIGAQSTQLSLAFFFEILSTPMNSEAWKTMHDLGN